MALSLIQKSWVDYPDIIESNLTSNQSVLEIGSGPNPSISREIAQQFNIDYHLNDYSKNELQKGKNDYQHFPGDFITGAVPINNKYDLVLSKMVLEHIPHPKAFHTKVFDHLKPGGIAIHFFATLYSLPAVFNLILPEFISTKLVKWGQGRDEEYHGKFPAMYKWCRGPVKGFSDHFENLGYQVIEHRGYVGHGYLSSKKYLWPIEKSFSKILLRINSPLLCSNSILILQKPL